MRNVLFTNQVLVAFYYSTSGRPPAPMLEADRGTMRGAGRMADKARGYAQLLGSDELAEATVGRRSFRLLVVTLDAPRRACLADEMGLLEMADRLFVATVSDRAEGGLSRCLADAGTGRTGAVGAGISHFGTIGGIKAAAENEGVLRLAASSV